MQPDDLQHSSRTYGSETGALPREIVQITLQYDPELDEWVEDFQVLHDSGPDDELTDEEWAVLCEQIA